MELRIKRKFLGENYTVGDLFVDGKFFCNTLEDANRDINKNGRFDNGETKVYGKTCIPFGKYRIELKMSPRFKRLLPRLLNVPSFEGVLIHRGNTVSDTSGCVLVGMNTTKGKVVNSTVYEKRLVELMKQAVKRNEQLSIEIS